MPLPSDVLSTDSFKTWRLNHNSLIDEVLAKDGSIALTSNWDAGSFQIRAETFQSDVTTGTAPFTIASTTLVTNLNADLLDGNHASAFSLSGHDHSGVYEPVDATILREADVDDTPVNGATTAPISSNWAFDHTDDPKAHWKLITSTTDLNTLFTPGEYYWTSTSVPSNAPIAGDGGYVIVTDEGNGYSQSCVVYGDRWGRGYVESWENWTLIRIPALDPDSSPDPNNDYVMTWDDSAATNKKVLLSNIGSSGAGVEWTEATNSSTLTANTHYIIPNGYTVTLPASPSAEDFLVFAPEANWEDSIPTVNTNSHKINSEVHSTITLDVNCLVTMVYRDATIGWSITSGPRPTTEEFPSGALIATNNLSDLNNTTTARSNLGLGTAAVADVDDTPVNGATADPISSNWAYDHENAADPHPQYTTTGKAIAMAIVFG